jgi:hypothetical protein
MTCGMADAHNVICCRYGAACDYEIMKFYHHAGYRSFTETIRGKNSTNGTKLILWQKENPLCSFMIIPNSATNH